MLIRRKIIQTAYDSLRSKVHKDARVPNLINKRTGKYTIQGLTFVYLGMNLNKVVEKKDILAFLTRHGCNTTDLQPRHLGMQYGLSVIGMNGIHKKSGKHLRAGQFCLDSLVKAHPASYACAHRQSNMTAIEFTALKKKYKNRCACCGSTENDANLKNPKVLTTIQKGHIDPRLPLIAKNCIPMCQVCNSVYRDKFVFTRRGFIKCVLPKSRPNSASTFSRTKGVKSQQKNKGCRKC